MLCQDSRSSQGLGPAHNPPCTLKLLTTSISILTIPQINGVHVLILKYPALYTAPKINPTRLPDINASIPPIVRYTNGTNHTHPNVSAIGFSPNNFRFFAVKLLPTSVSRYRFLCHAAAYCIATAHSATIRCAPPVVMKVQYRVNFQTSWM